ncbi:c-type cytochrome [Oceanisphaera sp. W20_SRM_FM3]|uniref:c-type cytochrome n=1 Tax=Oceanisphaera sp. W20_SRM_FM3 TaxID=3240267 RepID=UPI003F9B8A2C
MRVCHLHLASHFRITPVAALVSASLLALTLSGPAHAVESGGHIATENAVRPLAMSKNACAANPCSAANKNGAAKNPCAVKSPCSANPSANKNPWATKNPCAIKSPCSANPCAAKPATVNPCAAKAVQRPAKYQPYQGDNAELVTLGKALFNDTSLSSNGLACSSCHQGQMMYQASFALPYPHPVAMAQDQFGLSQVHLDEMIQICMVYPMATQPLAWDSKELAALVAYVQTEQTSYSPSGANPCAAKNPCAMKHPCAMKSPCKTNPCAMKNPCAVKSPCSIKNPCAIKSPCKANPCAVKNPCATKSPCAPKSQ